MNMRKSVGFTLVEVLVALTLGLFLTAGLIQLFVANSQTNRVAAASARIQENARFAMELLARDIRMAGYLGCASSALQPDNNLNDSELFPYDFATAVQGFEATGTGTWSPNLDSSIVGALDGRDVLTIRGIFEPELEITGSAAPLSCLTAALLVDDPSRLRLADIAIAGDCRNAAIFQITGLRGHEVAHRVARFSPGNFDDSLGACFDGGGNLGRLSTRTFFVAENDQGIPCLYRLDTSGSNDQTVELVEGVADMQILYGLEITGEDPTSVDQYMPANLVPDWEGVASVRIELLISSTDDNLASDSRTREIAGTPTTDRRLYRTFNTTLGVRNGLP